MAKRSADFKEKTLMQLRERVACRCSNPDCRVPTVAANTGGGVTRLGEGAHICAASPEGPRFDPGMTDEQRSHINNGIWLCSNCHAKVDADERQYTVDVLLTWRCQAEEFSRLELAQKLPSQDDGINLLSAAIGVGAIKSLSEAVRNICRAKERDLERYDNRFRVSASMREGAEYYSITAKENVPVSLTLPNVDGVLDSYRELIEYGKPFAISSEGVGFSGSPLFDEVLRSTAGNGRFSIVANGVKSSARLEVLSAGGFVLLAQEFQGLTYGGARGFSFVGKVFEVLSLEVTCAFSANPKVSMRFEINFSMWEGVNLLRIPCFQRIFDFYRVGVEAARFKAVLDLDESGHLVSAGGEVDGGGFSSVAEFLSYLDGCRKICRLLGVSVTYGVGFYISRDDLELVLMYSRIIDGEYIFDEGASVSSMVVNLGDADGLMAGIGKEVLVRNVEDEGPEILIFGKAIRLPARVFEFGPVVFSLAEDASLPLVNGQCVGLDVKPVAGFTGKITLR